MNAESNLLLELIVDIKKHFFQNEDTKLDQYQKIMDQLDLLDKQFVIQKIEIQEYLEKNNQIEKNLTHQSNKNQTTITSKITQLEQSLCAQIAKNQYDLQQRLDRYFSANKISNELPNSDQQQENKRIMKFQSKVAQQNYHLTQNKFLGKEQQDQVKSQDVQILEIQLLHQTVTDLKNDKQSMEQQIKDMKNRLIEKSQINQSQENKIRQDLIVNDKQQEYEKQNEENSEKDAQLIQKELLQDQSRLRETQYQLQQLNIFCQFREHHWINFVYQLQKDFQIQFEQQKDDINLKYKKDIENQQIKYNQIKNEKENVDFENNRITKELELQKKLSDQKQNKLNEAFKVIKSLEQEMDNYIKKGVGEKQASSQKVKGYKKLQGDISYLNKSLQDQKYSIQILRNQQEQEKQQIKANYDGTINQYITQISVLQEENGKKNLQIEGDKKQVSNLMKQLKNLSDEKKHFQDCIMELKQKVQELSVGGDYANRNVRDINQQLFSKLQEIEVLNKNNDDMVQKQQYLTRNLNESENQLKQLRLHFEILQRELKNLKLSEIDLIEENKKIMNDLTKQSKEEGEKFRSEIDFRDKVIKQLCQRQQGQYIDKVIGPLEKIMNSEFKINIFADDPNSQSDQTDFFVYEVTLDKEQADKYLQQSNWMEISECLQYQSLGSIKTIRSIQHSADATFLKGYIIQVLESENEDLKQKKLLRKEYKLQAAPMLLTKEEAGKQSMDSLLCKMLLDKFQNILKQPKVQGRNFKIQRQFVLQIKDKEEFCYCEMIEEGQFEKVNGGVSQVKDSELHQYFNSFSLFTYHLMNRQLIITNLQVVGNYVHDMIVSTIFRVFSPIDQGLSEIVTALGIIENIPQESLSKFWNKTIEQQAKQGWK